MNSWKDACYIFIVAYVLNFVWERLHIQLYDVNLPAVQEWLLLMRVTFWDAVIITGVYVFIDTKNRAKRYILSAALCLGIAIFIEQRAFAEGRWAYLPTMPLVMGMGVSPLIQLPLLAIATYEIVRRIKKQ